MFSTAVLALAVACEGLADATSAAGTVVGTPAVVDGAGGEAGTGTAGGASESSGGPNHRDSKNTKVEIEHAALLRRVGAVWRCELAKLDVTIEASAVE